VTSRSGQDTDPKQQQQDAETDHASGQRPPDYVIVIDQLRDRTWDTGISLAEALEVRSSRLREPEPDLEAEP
jgi:hypothetical protein